MYMYVVIKLLDVKILTLFINILRRSMYRKLLWEYSVSRARKYV